MKLERKIYIINMLDNDKTITINSVKKERIIPLPKIQNKIKGVEE